MKIFRQFFFHFNSTGDYALMAAEFMFCLFILYYIVEESLEIKIHGIAYFFTFWNILDLGVIGVRIDKIVRKFSYIKQLLKGLMKIPPTKDFDILTRWQLLLLRLY